MSDQKPEINIVPLEHKNRFASQAFQAWGTSESLKKINLIPPVIAGEYIGTIKDSIKKEFIDNFVKAKEDAYMQRERDKNAFNEMHTAMTDDIEKLKAELAEAKERLVKLQAPTR